MHDLTKIQKTFNEIVFSRLRDNILERNGIGKDEELIGEELFSQREIITVPFGHIEYFLAIEDEKVLLYVEKASRMGSHDICIIDDDSYECIDVYDGYPPELKEKYFGHLKRIKKRRNRFEENLKKLSEEKKTKGEMKMDCIKNGIMGQIVGDALGLPVQFQPREERDIDPVTDMIGDGAFELPAGSWSDDSSLILATMDGLIKSLNEDNDLDSSLNLSGNNDLDPTSLNEIIDWEIIMRNFSNWLNLGDYTPYGFSFDIGGATMAGICRYDDGWEPLECGGIGERDNGNGSLMRILPIAFFIYHLSKKYSFTEEYKMTAVHNLSSLTHRHKRSQMCCGIYVNIALEFIDNFENGKGLGLEELISSGINKSKEYYFNNYSFEEELHHFDRVFSLNIQNLPRDEIKSGGYCISSLEASIWCLLNNENYKDTLLTAVNLGYDTDTTACVVGGLAGIFYGYEDIPTDWIKQLAKLNYIEDLIGKFSQSLFD